MDSILMTYEYERIEQFELSDMPTPDIKDWIRPIVDFGPILDTNEMSEQSQREYYGNIPLSPEAEEMLAAVAIDAQVKKLDDRILELTQLRDELLEGLKDDTTLQ